MPCADPDIVCIRSAADMEPLLVAWHTLAQESAPTPFQTPQWHSEWWRLVGSRRSDLAPRLLAAVTGGEVAALAPLMIGAEGSVRRLQFATHPWADYADVLASSSTAADVLADRILGRMEAGLGEEWEVVDLRDVRPGSPLVQAAVAAGWDVEPDSVAGQLDLRSAVGMERALRSGEYTVKERRLQRAGEVGCRHLSEAADIHARMPDFIAMHLRQWMGRPDRGITFDDPDVVRFYSESIECLAHAGLLLLSELTLDGRPLAYYLGFHFRRRYWGYRTAYEVTCKQYSPGHLLQRRMFQDLAQAGIHAFDFMRGDYAYKWDYATSSQTNMRLERRG